MLDDVRTDDVVVNTATSDCLEQTASLRDVIHFFDLLELVRDLRVFVLGDQFLPGRVVNDFNARAGALGEQRVVRRTDLQAEPRDVDRRQHSADALARGDGQLVYRLGC